MTKPQARRLSWLIAVGLTAALFVCAFVFLDVRYAVNDDTGTLHMFQGYMSGEPATFHIYLHGLLTWPLCWLGRLAPTVAWYSYLQLAFLFVSCVVMAKSILQIFARRGGKLWAGAAMAAATLACLCLRYITRITFTQTAALLGAAAVLQMLSIEHDQPRKVVWGMAGALVLVVLAYALRQLTALPILAVCGLVFIYLLIRHYGKAARPMVVSALMVAVVMGGLAGVRELEIDLGGRREHIEWQQARIALLDYHDLNELPQEAVDAAGWSPAVFEMLKEWGFMDASVTTESFRRALEVAERADTRTVSQKLADTWTVIVNAVRDNPQDMRCLALLAIVLAACFAGALTSRENRGLLTGMVLALTALLAAMLCYLAWKGRLPARAMLMAALPMAAALIGLLPECLPKWKGTAAALVCAVYAVGCVLMITPELLKNEELDAVLGNAAADLEEYALWEPEALFIYDQTLSGADTRLFPAYPDGVPDNVSSWGGWSWGGPQSRAMWERFGVDVENFDPAVFVDKDVYIASGQVAELPELVLNWLREKLGDDVQCEYYSENGTVYFFYFYQ